MRVFLVFLFLISATAPSNGQLPDGSLAPDFTATDLNGQTYHLYELLEQGKIVILEISATWCPPCWVYHNSGALQAFYNQYGPYGADKARVFFIEGDPNTNVECLFGALNCGGGTIGNWTSGTNYPIINDHTIADAFEISFYPSLFIICPNKKVYQAGQVSAGELWEQAQQCPVAYGENNAGIFQHTVGTPLRELCGVQMMSPAFTLVNLGSDTLTNATIKLSWNGSTVETLQWNGSLGLYGEDTVQFSGYYCSGEGTLKTSITGINNGSVDQDFSNNVQNEYFTEAKNFDDIQILLRIRTDDYGSETYWELRDDQGWVLDYGGNINVGPNGGGIYSGATPGPGAYGNNVVIKDTLHLPGPGCYSIHFVDAFGDGMCCEFGNGYYRLFNLSNTITPVLTGGEFTANDEHGFSALGGMQTNTSISATQYYDIVLSPNPGEGYATINLLLPEPQRLSVSVYDAIGRLYFTKTNMEVPAGDAQIDLNGQDWPRGLYTVQIRIGAESILKKWVISR